MPFSPICIAAVPAESAAAFLLFIPTYSDISSSEFVYIFT